MIKGLDKAGYRKFGLIISFVVSIVFGIILPFLLHRDISFAVFYLCLFLVFLSLVLPEKLKYIYYPCMYISNILAIINSKILLMLFFYLIICPVAFLLRMMNKELLDKKFISDNLDTYWTIAKRNDIKRMDKMW